MGLKKIFVASVFAAFFLGGGYAAAYDAEFDYNGDGAVDQADLDIITAHFNLIEGDADFDSTFDHDGDGYIGGSDILLVQAAIRGE